MVNTDKYNPHKQQFLTALNTFLKSVNGSWDQNFLELLIKGDGWVPIRTILQIKIINLKKSFKNDQMAFESDKKQAETGMRSTLGRMEQLWIIFHFYGF